MYIYTVYVCVGFYALYCSMIPPWFCDDFPDISGMEYLRFAQRYAPSSASSYRNQRLNELHLLLGAVMLRRTKEASGVISFVAMKSPN